MRHRILIADDNRDAAESLALFLETMGHETHTAHDGREALACAERVKPEVVLLDIGMPVINGYDVCRRLRACPGGESLLILALTGWGQPDDRRQAVEAGFDDHLVKPVDPLALATRIAGFAPIGLSH